MTRFTIEILNEKHDLSSFDCGNADLNDFLKSDSLKNQEERFSVTRLIIADGNLAGFYSMTPDTLHKGRVDISDKIPNYPYEKYPAIKLARLAVDRNYQHKGIGRELLISFFSIANNVSKITGGRYLTVDSKREACEFYERFGFKPVMSKKYDDILPMYLDMNHIFGVVEKEQKKE